MPILIRIVLIFLMALLAACSSPTSPGGGDDKGTVTIPPPNPLDVGVTLDEARAVSQKIPLTGGSMSVTAEDGAVYTLTVPDNALLSETEITMTPIINVEGAPIEGGTLYGVELKPHGLRLYDFATLTIAPPADSGAKAVGFASEEGGKDFHLYPLSLEPGLSMKLMHFSEHGVFTYCETCPILIIDDNPTNSIPIEFVPIDWESQLAQMMEELIRNEREAHLRGEEGDPEFSQKLTKILNAFYIEIIQPMLGRITTDCDFAKANVSKVLSWNRQVALLGLDDTFDAKTASVTEAVVTGMDNCWKKAIEPCVDPSDAEQFAEVVATARLNLLLGGSSETYNPFNPDIQCDCTDLVNVETWSGSASLSYEQTASGDGITVQVQRSANFTFQLSREDYDEQTEWSSVTVTGGEDYLRDSLVSAASGNEIAWTGSGTPKEVIITLEIEPETCVYHLDVMDIPNSFHNKTGAEGFLFSSFTVRELPLPDASTLSGSMVVPSFIGGFLPSESAYFLFSPAFAQDLTELTNNTFNEAQIAWSLTPAE